VTILEPNNPAIHNNLAWAMTSVPGPTPFPAARALASAWRAVELNSGNWIFWNTLGVVAFRSQDWKTAAYALQRSIKLNDGGGAIDFFFLAMTRWHQGQAEEANKLFNRAADYVKHNPSDPELNEFEQEASILLERQRPKPDSGPHQVETEQDLTESARAQPSRTKKFYYFMFGLLPALSIGDDDQAG
jgi:hypothetical protein